MATPCRMPIKTTTLLIRLHKPLGQYFQSVCVLPEAGYTKSGLELFTYGVMLAFTVSTISFPKQGWQLTQRNLCHSHYQ